MKWVIAPKISDDLKLQLLHNRGLSKPDEIEKFFHPKLEDYLADIEIKGIAKARARIQKALKDHQEVIVYGDYDVDGVTSTTICYKALTSLGVNILPFIPHRDRDGYGLSKSGLDTIREKHPEAKLIITVDNGIVAIEQAKYAKQLGFDLIITDHHLPLDTLPEADAIVHSTKMCGAGVIWCLMRAMIDPQLTDELLQFVAIGTICDAIPLMDLGRCLVVEGLKVLNKTTNPGLKALFVATSLELGQIGAFEIGHIIGPKINAAGRIDHALPALKMLCTPSPSKAMEYVSQLMQANTSRQDLTTIAVAEALLQVGEEDKLLITSSPEWISGVIGLIAARLCEEKSRPAIAIAMGEEVSKGSARSIEGVNIVDILRQSSDLLIDVGGHSGAAGFSLLTANIDQFKSRIATIMTTETFEISEKVLEVEAEIPAKEINRHLLDTLHQFEPFGHGNPLPLFGTRSVPISDIKTVGNSKHLKFKADGKECIAFSKGELSRILREGQLIDVVYSPEWNRFNGREILQLKVKDLIPT